MERYISLLDTILDAPAQPQRQDSVSDQLLDLHAVAIRLGMYDAADWMRNHGALPPTATGCYECGEAVAADAGEPQGRAGWVHFACNEP